MKTGSKAGAMPTRFVTNSVGLPCTESGQEENSMMTKFISTRWQMALMAFQYMRGRKLRTTLTTLAIVFGVALIFAVNLTLPGVTDSFQRSMNATSGAVDLRITSVTGEAVAPNKPMQAVAGVQGVQAVTGSLR